MEAVQGRRRRLDFRADPSYGFDGVGMLLQEGGIIENTFIVEHPISELPKFVETKMDSASILLMRCGSMWKRACQERAMRRRPELWAFRAVSIEARKYSRPKSKTQTRHHSPRNHGFPGVSYLALCRLTSTNLVSLERHSVVPVISPIMAGENEMQTIAQREFQRAEAGIEGFTEFNIPKVGHDHGQIVGGWRCVSGQPICRIQPPKFLRIRCNHTLAFTRLASQTVPFYNKHVIPQDPLAASAAMALGLLLRSHFSVSMALEFS